MKSRIPGLMSAISVFAGLRLAISFAVQGFIWGQEAPAVTENCVRSSSDFQIIMVVYIGVVLTTTLDSRELKFLIRQIDE